MLDRYLYDFEAVGGDDAAGGASPADPAAGAADPGDGGGDAWSGPDQATWESQQQQLQEQSEAIQYLTNLARPTNPFQGSEQQGPAPITVDPYDEDNFQAQLDAWADQKFAGYAEYVQTQQMREGSARADDILADDISKNGDFLFNDPKSEVGDSKAKARVLADSYIPEMNQQFPQEPWKAAEAALARAAQEVRSWEKAVGEAYHQQKLNELSGLSGARREMPAGAINGQQFNMPAGGSLVDVAYRHGNGRG